tara:strand:+ start:130 stop:669 length:540 start_codon:yes stop_codon:yes gene_type:complete
MTSKLKVNIISDSGDNAIMTSDGSGSLTLNNAALKMTPAFFAKLSGNQTISNDTTTVMAFDTEVYDTDSAFDTSNYRFTVPSGNAGKYVFTATGGFSNADQATAARYQLMFFKNGSLEDFMGDWAQAQNSSADPTNNFTTQISLTAGDYIDARIYHNGGATETLQSAYARFYGYRLIGV